MKENTIMNYDSAHNHIDPDALVNRFGFPPLVKGETLEAFKRVLRKYIDILGSQEGIHWQDIWDHLIATWRLKRYLGIKASKPPADASPPAFATTFGAWATPIRL